MESKALKYFLALLISLSAFGQNKAPFKIASQAISYTTVRDTIDAANRNGYSLIAETYEIEDGIHVGGDDTYYYDAGLEFQLNIPQGSTIDTAFIYMNLNTNSGWLASDTIDIGVYNVDNASVFVTGHTHTISNHQTMSATKIAWGGVTQTSLGDAIVTPNIKNVIQVAVNRGSWSANNYVGIVLAARTQTLNHHLFTFSYGGGVAEWIPSIRVVYH
jgi:hypothetical protein